MPAVIRNGDIYYAQKGANFEGNLKIDGSFIVPARTNFSGHLTITGTLELGPGSCVSLGVNCWNAVIGRQSKIKGPLVAHGDVTILDNAVVHSVTAGGKVILRKGVRVGDVISKDTIIIYGRIKSGKLLGKKVKILED
jgi:cytoskeletal protein CcmA (bactofilin family)